MASIVVDENLSSFLKWQIIQVVVFCYSSDEKEIARAIIANSLFLKVFKVFHFL